MKHTLTLLLVGVWLVARAHGALVVGGGVGLVVGEVPHGHLHGDHVACGVGVEGEGGEIGYGTFGVWLRLPSWEIHNDAKTTWNKIFVKNLRSEFWNKKFDYENKDGIQLLGQSKIYDH